MTVSLTDWPPETMSKAEKLALVAERDPEKFREIQTLMSKDQHDALMWDWDFWARPDQMPPDKFSIWLILAGRGVGKSRLGMQWVRKKGPQHRQGLIIGANPRDVRSVLIEGPSGIRTISPPWERPEYEPTKLQLKWPNGAIAHVRSAEDPHSIRGLSVEYLYADELCKWRFLQETWDQARLALREGSSPQTVITTTPIPVPLIKRLAKGGPGIVVAPPMPTYRNLANLTQEYIKELLETYEGTRLGDQELHGLILEDIKGAMLNHELIEAARWTGEWIEAPTGLLVPALRARRRVVGVDPSGTQTGDEWGIVVCGSDGARPACGYVLDDRSQRGSTEDCARVAVRAYFDHNCEAMIGEVNFGADFVWNSIRSIPAEGAYPAGDTIRFIPVRAGRGQSKFERAMPIVGFFEQNLRGFNRIRMVGVFKDLEAQWASWVPPENADGVEVFASKWSPDRIDAMVWALHYLMVARTQHQGRGNADALASLPDL